MAGVQVLSFNAIKELESSQRIKKILEIVKKGDIVMFEGRLDPNEELQLTTKALESVSGKFTGIELAYLGDDSKSFLERVKKQVVKLLNGYHTGITVVGPSKIIKEIKMDPNNLEILFK